MSRLMQYWNVPWKSGWSNNGWMRLGLAETWVHKHKCWYVSRLQGKMSESLSHWFHRLFMSLCYSNNNAHLIYTNSIQYTCYFSLLFVCLIYKAWFYIKFRGIPNRDWFIIPPTYINKYLGLKPLHYYVTDQIFNYINIL